VVERGQYLSLVTKAAQDEIRVHTALDELDGDALLKGIVGALGQVNRPHPTAPYLSDDPVRADTLTDDRIVVYESRQCLDSASRIHRLVKKVTGLVILREQSFYLTPQLVVARAGFFDIRGAHLRREVKRRLKYIF
jgi:hypothetical protein